MTKVVEPKIGLWEKLYVPEITRGLGVTLKHFFYNFPRRLAGMKSDIVTIEYPEKPQVYAPRFRGQHRLTTREDGNVRCVACMCCSTACPSNCIRIVASEAEEEKIEKFPIVFEIDQLRCVFCGMCVEACPCDAIRMDTGVHVRPVFNRGAAIHTKDLLMSFKGIDGTKLSSAIQGGSHKGGMTAALRERIANDLNPLDPTYEPRPDNEKLDAKPEAHAPKHDAHGAHH
jgi:NADH-quinone oxidoreductase subunit I